MTDKTYFDNDSFNCGVWSLIKSKTIILLECHNIIIISSKFEYIRMAIVNWIFLRNS